MVHGNGTVTKHLMFSTTIPGSEEMKKEVEDVGCQSSKEDKDEWPNSFLPLRCIVALAILNSERVGLQATEIYRFMTYVLLNMLTLLTVFVHQLSKLNL